MKRKGIISGITILFVFAMTGALKAQDYSTAVGARFGGTSGITVKHNYSPNSAFEGIVGIFDHGMSFTFLWEKHPQAFNARGLHWYYGGGPHLAIYDENDRFGFGRDINDRDDDDLGIGVNGIIGLEYKFPDNVPVAMSIGLKPFVEFDTDGDVDVAPDPGFGVKLTF